VRGSSRSRLQTSLLHPSISAAVPVARHCTKVSSANSGGMSPILSSNGPSGRVAVISPHGFRALCRHRCRGEVPGG
jgi:hypothetical protein